MVVISNYSKRPNIGGHPSESRTFTRPSMLFRPRRNPRSPWNSRTLVEPPGTAPGSGPLITSAIYRHRCRSITSYIAWLASGLKGLSPDTRKGDKHAQSARRCYASAIFLPYTPFQYSGSGSDSAWVNAWSRMILRNGGRLWAFRKRTRLRPSGSSGG